MKIGEFIKYCRTGHNVYNKSWTQEELGLLLLPPVKRAAVNKWETGVTKNIRMKYIRQLSRIFGVTPAELLQFGEFDESKLAEEVVLIENIQLFYGENAVKVLEIFSELNDDGQERAINAISDLSEIAKYRKGSR